MRWLSSWVGTCPYDFLNTVCRLNVQTHLLLNHHQHALKLFSWYIRNREVQNFALIHDSNSLQVNAIAVPASFKPATLWRYAAWFWAGFASLSYIQGTLWLWVRGEPMPITDTLHWLIRWLLWLGATPLMVWMVQRYPVPIPTRITRWLLLVSLHLAFITGLIALITGLEYGLMYPLEIGFSGDGSAPLDAVGWFFSRYSTFVAIYMLIVAGYQFLATSAQNQHLREQALKADLKAQRIQSQLEQAQLQALKMQLNPHFIFNAHHTLMGLILRGEHPKAIQMLQALSQLLRTIVDSDEVQLVRLQEEMDFIDSYLSIQQIRYQDRLTIRMKVDPAALSGLLPAFILQPLVENAFVHGLERVAGPVELAVTATLTDQTLVIHIQDNGAGLRTTPPVTGVGLRNTLRRLNQLYGSQASLQFTPTPGRGTTCQLRIPQQPISTLCNGQP